MIIIYLLKETRECKDLDQCVPDIPNYRAVEMFVQANLQTRIEATFSMEEIEFIPFGELYFQEMQLLPLDKDFDNELLPNVISWKSDEFNQTRIAQNLIVNVTYQPKIKVFALMNNMNNMKRQSGSTNITDELYTYYGEVRKSGLK